MIFHFGTSHLMCQNNFLGVVGGVFGRNASLIFQKLFTGKSVFLINQFTFWNFSNVNTIKCIFAKLQFMVFQKYCSEKSEMHYWYIIHDIKEISEKILKFQQCVLSQSPTNLSICCHLVYQCLCTEKKITQFKWKFMKTLPIIHLY